jgi:glycosyltransferase involved in cell wall biosynthesis
VISALSAGQKAAGHEVHVAAVLTAEPVAHPFVNQLRELGIETHILVAPARAYRAERDSVRRLCIDLRPSVVHTHGYRPDIVDGGVARQERIASVSTVHGFIGGGVRNRLYEYLQCRFLRGFDAVVAVSAPIYKRLVDAGVPPIRTHILPNSFTSAAPGFSREAARQILGIERVDRPVVGFVGRLSAEKGPDVLLEAIPHINADVSVSFVGDGRLRPVLVQRANVLRVEDRVVWHGITPDAGRLLAAFDVVVLSSRTEGTPVVLLEALSAGVPVVTTAVGGIPDVVSPQEAILVPPDDPRALARGIGQSLAKGPEVTDRISAGLDLVRRRFDTAAWVAEYEGVYRDAVAVQNWKYTNG